jgi:hypothetical protein
MERRGFLEFVGGIGFGGLLGYYAGAQELLGIQSETPPPETETPPPEAETQSSTDNRFSFEEASVGNPVPTGKWYVMTDEGPHQISDERATDGKQSMYLRGSGGLGQTRIAIDLDFSRIETIAFDAYPVQNNTYSGDIKIHINNTNNGIGGVTEAATGQWHEISGSVSEFDGANTLFLRTRGDGNEAFFDNGRLLNKSGELISPEEVIISG